MKTAAKIDPPAANLSAAVRRLIRNPSQRVAVLERLLAGQGSVRFRDAKLLLLLSEQAPAVLYRHFEVFERLLEDENQIIRWNAIRMLANLAPVDAEGRLERLLDRYLAFIQGPVMITAANVIAGAAKIARAKPHLTEKVIEAILKVERANYQTRECRNVAIGHALKALGRLGAAVAARPEVQAFARRQRRNPRAATRRKAAELLKTTEDGLEVQRESKRLGAHRA